MATVTRFPSSKLFISAQQTAPAEHLNAPCTLPHLLVVFKGNIDLRWQSHPQDMYSQLFKHLKGQGFIPCAETCENVCKGARLLGFR